MLKLKRAILTINKRLLHQNSRI